mgnify:CR=1 FL=1
MCNECRAGQRRFEGTERGDAYQHHLAFLGEGNHEDHGAYERTLGDYLTPTRPGRMMDVVNTVTRDAGFDTAEWGVSRLLSMVVNIEREANARPEPDA